MFSACPYQKIRGFDILVYNLVVMGVLERSRRLLKQLLNMLYR
jgi:hypothetical protein